MFNPQPMIGDVVPFAPGRLILGAMLVEPKWFILTTPPMKERKAARWLERQGFAADALWFPTTRVMRGRGVDRYEAEQLVAPGYLFALFSREPRWDNIVHLSPMGCVRGVVGHGEVPYVVPLRVMAQMAMMPARIAELRDAEAAEAASRLPKPRDKARLLDGPLSGFVVDITSIDGGLAHFLTEHGIKGQAQIATMEKVA